jgi:hypothetical protein
VIASGALTPPTDRFADSPLATFPNAAEFASYKIVFNGLRDVNGAGVDSMQIGEVQLDGTFVPEPGTMGLTGAALAGFALRRRRRPEPDRRA